MINQFMFLQDRIMTDLNFKKGVYYMHKVVLNINMFIKYFMMVLHLKIVYSSITIKIIVLKERMYLVIKHTWKL